MACISNLLIQVFCYNFAVLSLTKTIGSCYNQSIISIEKEKVIMANRIMLNETSYHGAGAIEEIATEAKARAFKKHLYVLIRI